MAVKLPQTFPVDIPNVSTPKSNKLSNLVALAAILLS